MIMGVFKRRRKSKDGSMVPYWYIRYAYNGKIKWEGVGKVGVVTKDVARAKLEERKRQIRLGQLDMIGTKIPTLSEFAKEYIKYVQNTVRKRSWGRDVYGSRHFLELFNERKLSELTPKDVDDYKQLRLTEVKPATVNRELQIIRHLFNLAYRWKRFFGRNPVAESRLLEVHNQVERILTPEEEARLLACCSPHLRAIVTCALNTGMRKGEIISLKWSNVDLGDDIITLEYTNTKSKKTRKIPINFKLRKLFLEQRLKSGGNEYVFLHSNGKPYARHDSLNRAFKGALRRAKIEGLRFHDLRHTAATRMIESDVHIEKVSMIPGHSSIQMTMRYAHPKDSLRDAVETLANYTSNYSQNCSQQNLED
jgi:integrase